MPAPAVISITMTRALPADADGTTTVITARHDAFQNADLDAFDDAAARSAINATRAAIQRAVLAHAAAVAADQVPP